MCSPTGVLALLFWLLTVSPVAAREFPSVIHGDAAMHVHSFGAVFEIESDATQVRLSRSLVATAGKGTAFELYAPLLDDDSKMLHVTRGSLVLIEEWSDRAETVAAGERFFYGAIHPARSVDEADRVRRPEIRTIAAATKLEDAYTQWQHQEAHPGFQLSDSVMTRQQEYLSSLKIDIIDLNRALSSFIRRLLFR